MAAAIVDATQLNNNNNTSFNKHLMLYCNCGARGDMGDSELAV